jgi:hypothetical protein
MKCPGQDRSCWTGERVREIPCPECGAAVEIFRDENAGRCLRCGHKFLAPGAMLGCAQWCSVAKECLGFAPQRGESLGSAESALAARLIQRVEKVFTNEPARIAYALRVFQFAKELVRAEGGDPRVVLCASLLLATDGGSNSQPEAVSVEEVLREMGLDEATLTRVLQLVTNYRTGQNMASMELQIVCDSEKLARWAVEPLDGSPDEREAAIHASLHTETGRRKARSLMQL